jgi:hypothetical protein
MVEQVRQQQHGRAVQRAVFSVLCYAARTVTNAICRVRSQRSTGGTPFKRPGEQQGQQLSLQRQLLLLCCPSTHCATSVRRPGRSIRYSWVCASQLPRLCYSGGPAITGRCALLLAAGIAAWRIACIGFLHVVRACRHTEAPEVGSTKGTLRSVDMCTTVLL